MNMNCTFITITIILSDTKMALLHVFISILFISQKLWTFHRYFKSLYTNQNLELKGSFTGPPLTPL